MGDEDDKEPEPASVNTLLREFVEEDTGAAVVRPLDAHVCAALGEALDATMLALAALEHGSLLHGGTRGTLIAQLRRAASSIHEAQRLVTHSGTFPAVPTLPPDKP